MPKTSQLRAYVIGSSIITVIVCVAVAFISLKAAITEGGDPAAKFLLPLILWIIVVLMIRAFYLGYRKLQQDVKESDSG